MLYYMLPCYMYQYTRSFVYMHCFVWRNERNIYSWLPCMRVMSIVWVWCSMPLIVWNHQSSIYSWLLYFCFVFNKVFEWLKLISPHNKLQRRYESFHAKTYNLVEIFNLYFFVQKLFSCYTWPLSDILGSRAGDLQRYDVINTSGVNFMSRCYMNFYCKR